MIHIHRATSTERNEKKKRWLSPSSINAYIRCPRKYYYNNIAKIKQAPSIYLIRGIAVHSAIENFYKYKIHRCASIAYSDLRKTVIDLFKDEWLNQKKGLNALKLSPDELHFFYKEGEKMVLNFLHDFLNDRGFEKPAPMVEKTLFSRKHMVLGRIDAIYHNKSPPMVLDYKTSKSKELLDDYKRQLAIYSLLYQEHYKKNPTLAIQFLKFENGIQQFRVSSHQLLKTKKLISRIHQKTKSENIEDYPCVCGWCHKNYT